jgi:hypothetical protein
MHFQKLFFALVFILLNFNVYSQADFKKLEADLAYQCDVMVNAFESHHRTSAHSKFIKMFEEALNQNKSYDYPFDSLKWISKKSPDDHSFRIFSWELKKSEAEFQYFGFIQLKDGQLIKLNDHFKEAEYVMDEEFTDENWLGAIYFNIMEMNPSNGPKYYLLFGLNRWNDYENIKLVDVLFFTKENQPIFGKPVFRKGEKQEKDVFYNRLLFKYASDANMTVNYNPGMEMIVFDNLIPKMSRIPGQGETLVPDGSYIGYSWDKKYWNRIDKIATQIMDTAPRPNPILDKRKGKKIFGN